MLLFQQGRFVNEIIIMMIQQKIIFLLQYKKDWRKQLTHGKERIEKKKYIFVLWNKEEEEKNNIIFNYTINLRKLKRRKIIFEIYKEMKLVSTTIIVCCVYLAIIQ